MNGDSTLLDRSRLSLDERCGSGVRVRWWRQRAMLQHVEKSKRYARFVRVIWEYRLAGLQRRGVHRSAYDTLVSAAVGQPARALCAITNKRLEGTVCASQQPCRGLLGEERVLVERRCVHAVASVEHAPATHCCGELDDRKAPKTTFWILDREDSTFIGRMTEVDGAQHVLEHAVVLARCRRMWSTVHVMWHSLLVPRRHGKRVTRRACVHMFDPRRFDVEAALQYAPIS